MDLQIVAQKFYDYSLSIRNLSPLTVRRYRTVIEIYYRFTGAVRIEEVTNDNVRDFFFYGRIQRKWSSNSFIGFHSSLLVFFRWCVQKGYMTSNPAEDVDVPKLEKRLPTKLTKQDAFKLLEVVYNYPYDSKFLRYRNHAIFSTFIFAGLRKSELLHLKLTDVDIDNLTLFVHKGKGNKDRMIPMSHTLAQSLRTYLEERRRLKKTCSEFFASSLLNFGFTDSGLNLLVKQLRNASGLRFTIHKLRHTFATLMLEGGCDIYSLSKMMGHTDISTTTIYLSASVEHLRSQMTKHPLND